MIRNPNEVFGSYVGVGSINTTSESSFFSEYSLRVGEVVKVIYPDDKDSKSKAFIEYNVNVLYKDLNTNVICPRVFYNCPVVNLFGGLADYTTYTLRAADPPTKKNEWGSGSQVLVLSIDSEYYKTIIIGGVKSTKDKTDNKELGHFYNFRFNGIDWNINKNGELIITYNGKSKIDGTTDVSESIIGTKFQMLKNGNVQFSTNSDEEVLLIDKENKKIELTVNGGNVIVKSLGLLVGDANEAFMLGTTYRQNETQLHNNLIAKLTSAISMLNISCSVANTSLAPALGGPLAAVAGPLSTVIASVQSLASTLGDIVSEITTFEGATANYISKKNFGD
jgi:hypothetical protein